LKSPREANLHDIEGNSGHGFRQHIPRAHKMTWKLVAHQDRDAKFPGFLSSHDFIGNRHADNILFGVWGGGHS
jgi:hypothetical protein